MSAEISSDRRQTSGLILVILGLLAIVGLALLLRPFLSPLAAAAILAVLTRPAFAWVVARTGRPSVVAMLMTLLIVSLLLVPAIAFVLWLLSSLVGSLDAGAAELTGGAWSQLASNAAVQRAASLVGIEAAELPELLAAKVAEQAGPIAQESLRVVSGFGAGLLDLTIVLFGLFYLLRDGPGLVERLVWLSPLNRERTERLIENGRAAIFATLFGNVGVAITQGILGGLAFAVVGIPSAVFWGVAMGFLALTPLIGAPLVWVPGGVILIVQGEILRGVMLLLFGALVISSVDNLLRALIVGGRTEIHPLAVFLSVLGGVVLFGATGVFLGPVLYVVTLSLLEMVRMALDQEEREGGLLTSGGSSS